MHFICSMNTLKRYCLFLFIVPLISSCAKDRLEKDINKIEKYLEKNNLTAEKTEDGLYYIITEEGTGDRPTVDNDVTVHYEGFTLKDEKFDSSYDRNEPATFPLNRVILGWQLGIPLFKEGGSGMLLIPSELAYGSNPPPSDVIGKNEVLIFNVELIEVL